jgi:hypothetical protein
LGLGKGFAALILESGAAELDPRSPEIITWDFDLRCSRSQMRGLEMPGATAYGFHEGSRSESVSSRRGAARTALEETERLEETPTSSTSSFLSIGVSASSWAWSAGISGLFWFGVAAAREVKAVGISMK